MVNALEEVLNLVRQAISYLFLENEITSVWFALVVLIVTAVYFILKLTNGDS